MARLMAHFFKHLMRISLFSLMVHSYGFTALPPLYESLKEYQALLSSNELAKHLDSSHFITSIERTDDGFTIVTNKTTLKARIIYEPQSHPGPAKFHFRFD